MRDIKAHLSQVSDQVEGDVSKGVVQVAADHVDPVRAVSLVSVR